MIHVFARNHNNVITMESPQTKPTPLDNQKGGAIKIDMGIEMNYGFWPKTISTPFFHAFKHSYDILGARMLWKPKEARILKNFIEF